MDTDRGAIRDNKLCELDVTSLKETMNVMFLNHNLNVCLNACFCHAVDPFCLDCLPPRKALTKAGFQTGVRDMSRGGGGSGSLAAAMQAKREAKARKLQEVTTNLVFALGLSALSGLAHLAHAWTAAPAWLHVLHSPPLQAALSVIALLGMLA
jgi:hypothetical protein